MSFTSSGLVSGVFRFSSDMLSGDVVSWIQIRYLRRDERTNYHPFHTKVRFHWHYSCNNQDLVKIPQHGHSFQAFQQCP